VVAFTPIQSVVFMVILGYKWFGRVQRRAFAFRFLHSLRRREVFTLLIIAMVGMSPTFYELARKERLTK